MFLIKALTCAAFLLTSGATLHAQGVQGIPIHDEVTIRKCGGCHQPDANGRKTETEISQEKVA